MGRLTVALVAMILAAVASLIAPPAARGFDGWGAIDADGTFGGDITF
jgi:hypothetical protein